MQNNSKNNPKNSVIIRQAFFEFVYFILIMLTSVVALYIEVFYLKNANSERSLIENVQRLYLAIMAIIFFSYAVKHEKFRGGFVLIGGFVLCMLIRENDQLSDRWFHGSWKYFALAVAVVCIFYAVKHINTSLDGLCHFIKTRDYAVFVTGLVVVLLVSRLFGAGEIWTTIMQDNYVRVVKNTVEEYSELVGYTIMLFASLRFVSCSGTKRQLQ
ncbi:MAG: hypothetical protein CSA47_01975 [Gammaproteobacteria bacterium]|nr:MAG: hypothetical protein CSA47_01975 [Gammaproteobacteria bacterium]